MSRVHSKRHNDLSVTAHIEESDSGDYTGRILKRNEQGNMLGTIPPIRSTQLSQLKKELDEKVADMEKHDCAVSGCEVWKEI
jgi:hypothetical protein